MSRPYYLLFLVFYTSECFLFGGGDCNSCCPPPIPCNCVPPAACQSYAPTQSSSCPCAAKARSEKTVSARPLDELELRAKGAGIPLDQQPILDSMVLVPRELELLERLGDDYQYRSRRLGPPVAQSYFSSPNVRFSPQNEEETSPEEETTVKMIDHSTTPDPLLELKEAHKEEDHEDIKCNSNVLRKIMIDKMTENSSVSKRQINLEAERVFGGRIDVVCSRGHFSYIYSSSLFCETSKGPTTCIAFRQTR